MIVKNNKNCQGCQKLSKIVYKFQGCQNSQTDKQITHKQSEGRLTDDDNADTNNNNNNR